MAETDIQKNTHRWTVVGSLAGVVGLLVPAVRSFLGWVWGGLISGWDRVWKWGWGDHQVNGWAILLMVTCTLVVLGRFIAALLRRRKAPVDAGGGFAGSLSRSAFSEVVEGVRWDGEISGDGLVHHLSPFCGVCGLQLRPAVETERFTWAKFTHLDCEDCGVTRRRLDGPPRQVEDRISRLIEARWRRDELGE